MNKMTRRGFLRGLFATAVAATAGVVLPTAPIPTVSPAIVVGENTMLKACDSWAAFEKEFMEQIYASYVEQQRSHYEW